MKVSRAIRFGVVVAAFAAVGAAAGAGGFVTARAEDCKALERDAREHRWREERAEERRERAAERAAERRRRQREAAERARRAREYRQRKRALESLFEDDTGQGR